MRTEYALIVGALAVLVGCGGGSSPTQPTNTTPSPTTFSLSGTIADSASGAGISGAQAQINDGPNAGKGATADSNGHYSFSGLLPSGFTVNFSAQYYTAQGQGVNLTSNQTLNAKLVVIPPFFLSGSGDNVFNLPSSIVRVKITADYTGFASNFIVQIGNSLLVNELMGTGFNETHFEGTYLNPGGAVQITHSSGVSWSFTEVR